MPVHSVYSFHEASVLVWKTTETIDELILLLSDVELHGYNELVSDKRKHEFLTVRVALKKLIALEVQIRYSSDGKPFLIGSELNISISHSGVWVAVMVHPTLFVGVDIEVPSPKIEKLYTRFLSTIEQSELWNGTNITKLQLAWSAKEALYKIIGKEAVDFAKQLRLFPFELATNGTICAEHIPTKNTFHLHYVQDPAYILVFGTN